MDNYYKNKLNELNKLEYIKNEPINDLCNIYLDNKPKNLNKYNRSEQFWTFIENFEEFELIEINLLVLCLVKGIKEKNIFSKLLIKKAFNKEIDILIKVIRYSKIFLEENNINYINIKEYYIENNTKTDFFKACTILLNKYNYLLEEKNKQNEILNSFPYLDFITLIALYMMKNVEENSDPSYFELNGRILSILLHDRLKTKDKKKREYLFRESSEKIFKLIMPRENYDELYKIEQIIDLYKEFVLFENNVISTFCFDDNYSYNISNSELELNVIDIQKHLKWLNENKKLNIFFECFFSLAIYQMTELFDETFGSIENDLINKQMFYQALGLTNLLKDIYGIEEKIYISDNLIIPLFETIHGISILQGNHQKFFLERYRKFLQNDNWNNAWNQLFITSIMENIQRFPLIIQKEFDFANNINHEYSLISKDDRQNIESFFTFDLKNIYENKEEKIPNIFEKPLFKLDQLVFIMPFVLGSQNIYTSIINNLLNIHFKRNKYRKKEVANSENNLSELFRKLNFEVQTNYLLPLSNDYDVGDIDLICKKGNYLFVLELKSTYIRTSLENIWNYKSNVIRKASYQLNKRKILINKLIREENKEFKDLFGFPQHIIYLIVDTSFEFDHEVFDENLKISMFELINLLNPGNKNLYPNGFSIEKFIKNINDEVYWEKVIDNKISIDEKEFDYVISKN